MVEFPGTWHWGRPVYSWRDAEYMAAAHMRRLGFISVAVTAAGSDRGVDVVAQGAAAQVKFHASVTGSPDIQRLRGAADSFGWRIFYATGFTTGAIRTATELNVATFSFEPDGTVVPQNKHARTLVTTLQVPAPVRLFAKPSLAERQSRVLLWVESIRETTGKPISNRKRKGARQLAERKQALALCALAVALVHDSDNPVYQDKRRTRTVDEAEKTVRRAAKIMGVVLR